MKIINLLKIETVIKILKNHMEKLKVVSYPTGELLFWLENQYFLMCIQHWIRVRIFHCSAFSGCCH